MWRLTWLSGLICILAILVVGAGRVGSPPASAHIANPPASPHSMHRANPPANPRVVLYDQYNNTGIDATSSQIFGQYYEDLNDQGADDFVVPSGQTWTVSQVEVEGQYDRRGGPASSVNVYIYRNASGVPGTAISTQMEVAYTSGPTRGSFVIPIASVTLQPGTYWVSVQANQDYVPHLMWYWNNRTVKSNNPAAYRNPLGGWRRGCPDWAARAGCKNGQPGEPDQVFRLSGSFTGTPMPTITGTPPTATPTVCGNGDYQITATTGATVVPGINDTGNHCIDCTSLVNLPFAYRLYDQTFTEARVDSNGTLQFQGDFTTFNPRCLPDAHYNYAIFPHWSDLDTGKVFCTKGCGIFTSISGNAPNRIFNIEWRASHNSGAGTTNFEVRLYENRARFDLIYAAVPETGTNAVVGVQRDAGSRFTEYECLTSGSLTPGLMLAFTLPPCPTSTPINTGTPIPTFTPVSTSTFTPTFTPSSTSTATRTFTVSPTPDRTITPVPTLTWTPTSTFPPTSTPTGPPTNTFTVPPVPTNTRTVTPTQPPTLTATAVPATPTLTPTSIGATATATATATRTPTTAPPSSTSTRIPPSPVPTGTAVLFTATATSTRTNTPPPPTLTFRPTDTETRVPDTATAIPTAAVTATSARTSTTGPTATITGTRTATTCPMRFSDVQQTDYFYAAVRYLYCAGAISGYADGTFQPGNSATRAQAIKMIVIIMGWAANCPSTPHFSDVPVSSPFFCSVETAYARHIITGYSTGMFHPDDSATRQQLSKIVVLARDWRLNCPSTPHFNDMVASSPFYCYVETAYSHGIILGYDDSTFRPANMTTRGQISTIIYRTMTQP